MIGLIAPQCCTGRALTEQVYVLIIRGQEAGTYHPEGEQFRAAQHKALSSPSFPEQQSASRCWCAGRPLCNRHSLAMIQLGADSTSYLLNTYITIPSSSDRYRIT